MRTAGIREVRQNLSALLREVRKGREIVITDRGEPVARLTPPYQGSARPFPDSALFAGVCRASIHRCRPPSLRTVPTVSEISGRDELAGPLYCDSSALAKLVVPEAGSDELNAAIAGRDDVLVSDLAVSEVASALGRRVRERRSTPGMRTASTERCFPRSARAPFAASSCSRPPTAKRNAT